MALAKCLLASLAAGLPRLTGLDFASDEPVAGDLLDMVEVTQDIAEFLPERIAACGQVRTGLDQVLVGGDLARGGKQQRGHRLAAADSSLGHVLAPHAKSQ